MNEIANRFPHGLIMPHPFGVEPNRTIGLDTMLDYFLNLSFPYSNLLVITFPDPIVVRLQLAHKFFLLVGLHLIITRKM